MNNTGPNPYLKTRIMTASPQELRLMLYDGALKFTRQAATAMDQEKFEDSYNALMRAQKIVLELSTSLNREADPDLTDKLAAIYTFIYGKLVEANVNRDPAPVAEAIRLLEYERDTWQMLMKKLAAEEGRDGAPPPIAGAQQTALSTYSKSA